jgi:PKD repeat protein
MKQIIKAALILAALATATAQAAYIKVDANGNALPDSATSWSCVYDDVNELLREVKTDDDGVHDKDDVYREGGANELSLWGENYSEREPLTDGNNLNTMCGHNNLEVPADTEPSKAVSIGQSPTLHNGAHKKWAQLKIGFRTTTINGSTKTASSTPIVIEGPPVNNVVTNTSHSDNGISTSNFNPIASIMATPLTGEAPLTVLFSGSYSHDNEGAIFQYQWEAPTSSTSTANGENVSFIFTTAGTHTVTLRVQDSGGAWDSDSKTITVTPMVESDHETANLNVDNIATVEPLTALFTVTPSSGATPLAVEVDASNSIHGVGSIIGYNWNLSDGQNGSGITHDFTLQSGDNTIMLTVTSSNGDTSTSTNEVVVSASHPTNYDTTARLSPQVIAAGISPTQVDYGDTEFDILAVVRPGILPIDRVTFRDSATQAFALQMEPAGVLENGDEVYKTTFSFVRNAFGDLVMPSAWGQDDNQYNIIAYDSAEQRSHQFPNLMFGDNTLQVASTRPATELSYNTTKRLGPQVVIAGFSPSKIDFTETSFDVIAIIRDGALPIDTVTVTQNQSPFELAMSNAGTLSNGDSVYKMTYTFQRNAFGTATLDALWGDQPGQFNIHATDSAQQRSHDFPDIMFGNYPAQ